MRILITGGGKLGRMTAEALTNSGHELRVIEKNNYVCETIASELDIMVLCGDATSPDLLEKAEIEKADIVIALSGDDKANLITALIAQDYGVKRVIIKLDDPAFNLVCIKLGLEEIINPKVAMAKRISDLVKAPQAVEISTLVGGSIRVFSAVIQSADHVGKHISELDLPQDCTPIVLKRNSEFLLVKPDMKLMEEDHLQFLCEEKSLDKLDEMFSAPVEDGK